MRSIILLSALLALFGTCFSFINPADQCTSIGVTDDSCIMCSGTPCMNGIDPVICPGTVNPDEPAWGPIAWIGGSSPCICYCPYSLVTAAKEKCEATCHTTCSGTTIKRGHCERATCEYDTGYCQNGCNAAGTDCATTVQTPTGWKQDDETCDTPKGENCDNSRADCACQSGWACNPSADDARDDGCAPVTGFDCNDNACDIAKGENCASCGGNNAPCACGDYETCSPSATGSDKMGCAKTPDSPCNTCNENGCFAKTDASGVQREFGFTKTGCISGQCIYSIVECVEGCDWNAGACNPSASLSPDGCLEDGTYVVTKSGQSGSITVGRQTVNDVAAASVTNGGKHCAGDIVTTDDSTKVWIKHKNGRVTYIGPRSIYTNSRVTPNTDIASGEIQESNTLSGDPGAVTDDEKGIVTLVPYQIGVDISKGTDYHGRQMTGNLKTLMDPRQDVVTKMDTLMNDMMVDYFTDYYGMPKWMGDRVRSTIPSYVKQHSDVLYQIDDTGVTITVLEGEATVVDPLTNQTVVVSPGESYSKPVGTSPTEGTKTTVDVSGIHNSIADMPSESCCGSAAILLAVLAGMAFTRRIR
ncbi:MAG: hypothetical protein PHV13_06175 [Candidatus ainarchaeum sp.]|nr:hypothetical protein [Candidatus ainarchaeum sp.]